MSTRLQLTFYTLVLALLTILPPSAMAWNMPAHMVHGAMTYQILRQENSSTIKRTQIGVVG